MKVCSSIYIHHTFFHTNAIGSATAVVVVYCSNDMGRWRHRCLVRSFLQPMYLVTVSYDRWR